MAKAKTAKTASKNNPSTREKAREFFYKGKKVKPCKFVGPSRTYMAAQYESGEIIENSKGDPMTWDEVVG